MRRVVDAQSAAVAMVHNPEDLMEIYRPNCAAAIWQRTAAAEFQSWIDSVDPACLPTARLMLRPSQARDAIRTACDLCGTPDCAERDCLVDDAAALAAIFSEILQIPLLRLRLEVLDAAARRTFQPSAGTAQLICTYRGTGTQYGFASGDSAHGFTTLQTGVPIILRGELWPERPAAGLMHRSRPIEGSGETRLLLAVDPVTAPEVQTKRGLLH